MSLRAKATLLLTTYNLKSSNNLTKRIDSDAGDYSVKPKMKYCIRPSICQGIGNGQFDNMRQAILGIAATFLFHVCDLPQEQTEWLASADGGGSSKDGDSGDTARLLGRVSWCACMLGIHLRAR